MPTIVWNGTSVGEMLVILSRRSSRLPTIEKVSSVFVPPLVSFARVIAPARRVRPRAQAAVTLRASLRCRSALGVHPNWLR